MFDYTAAAVYGSPPSAQPVTAPGPAPAAVASGSPMRTLPRGGPLASNPTALLVGIIALAIIITKVAVTGSLEIG